MMPSKAKYPDFVPDQLLTSENLNDLFRYLDEQGRISRTNLLGIGIVCGLDVKTAADGASITLTKGTGITSEGYLAAQEEMIYTQTIPFDATKELQYDKFLTASHQKKFDLWELKQSAAVEGATPLSLAFLNGSGVNDNKKVVLLFVELLQEHNKNCNPESCDDKGITINVNFRVLLARKQDVDAAGLKAGITNNPYYNNDFAALPEMRMRRFDVAASQVVSAAGLLTAYKKILTSSFLSGVEHNLAQAWAHLKPYIGSEFQDANPFQDLAESFGFINNGAIKADQLRNLQYIYDHFSDLMAAYEEFRRAGMEVLSSCCPDAALFPRHLLLDLAVADANALHPTYRHQFRPSPLFQKQDLLARLRSLFRRLVYMARHFKVPDPIGSQSNPDDTIRITPSRLDPSPLSGKAIPYYYEVMQPGAAPLYKSWSYEKTMATDPGDNLSYHAGLYATKDFVSHPLRYDLEPNNFLRVEGHLGKSFSHVMLNLKRLIKDNRLPIDVVALCLGSDASDTEIADPKVVQDIQVQYEVLRTEVICCLKRQVGYWGKLTLKDDFKYGKLQLATNLFTLFTGNQVLNFASGAEKTISLSTSAAMRAALGGSAAATATAAAPAAAAPATGTSAAATAPAASASGAAAAGAAASGAQALVGSKGNLVLEILGDQPEYALAKDYLRYQAEGNYNLSKIPAPAATAVLDEAAVSHFSLQILDEISELLVLLKAEDPLTLDTDAVTAHGKVLEKILDELLARVEKEIAAKRPFQKIKAYVGEAQHAKVDAIAEAMPDIGEDQANTVVLLLLNMPEAEKTAMINQLRSQRGNRANQVALLNLYFGKLDKDGMMVPPAKDVAVVEDAFLREIRDRLKNFTCLCALAGFAKLRELLKKILVELKQANLFSVFTAKHPGIQHKAGVPLGGTFVICYMRKGDKAADVADPQYGKVAAEFPDGMVVADFYLPYLSYSSHPPIIFQVNDAEPIPDVVTLGLQPNPSTGAFRYNVADETPYAFSHIPNNGTLTNGTAANGVTVQGADNFVFTPAKAKALLGNDFKAEIAFEYVKRGVASDKVRVTVFNVPTAEAKIANEKPEVPPGTNITIKGTAKHADKFSWTMQDAAGVSREVGTALDLSGFDLPKEGTFTFALRATQTETGAKAVSNTVTVKVRRNEDAPVKTCGNLLLILEAYERLPALDPRGFKAFEAAVLAKLGVQEVFEKLKGLSRGTEAQQLEFFKSKVGNEAGFTATVAAWMAFLAENAANEKSKLPRILCLALYGILADLILYVSCLRKEDLGKAEEQIFADMIIHLKGRGRAKGFLDLKELNEGEKAILSGMKDEFSEEVKRNALNNKITPKPKYARALKAVQAAF